MPSGDEGIRRYSNLPEDKDRPDVTYVAERQRPPERPPTADIMDLSEIDVDEFAVTVRSKVEEATGFDPLADPYALLETSPNLKIDATRQERNDEYLKISRGIARSKSQFDSVMKDVKDRRTAAIEKKEKMRLERKQDTINAEKKVVEARNKYRELGDARLTHATSYNKMRENLMGTEGDVDYDSQKATMGETLKQIALISQEMGRLEKKYNLKPYEPLDETGGDLDAENKALISQVKDPGIDLKSISAQFPQVATMSPAAINVFPKEFIRKRQTAKEEITAVSREIAGAQEYDTPEAVRAAWKEGKFGDPKSDTARQKAKELIRAAWPLL